MDPEEINLGLPVINPELRAQVLEYVIKINEFNMNLLKKHEETFERFLVIFDPKNKKKPYSLANRTRIVEKKWENGGVKYGHQIRGYSKHLSHDLSLDAPDPVTDVTDMSVRSTRRAAQIANMKNKTCLGLSLNKKLRQPSMVLETTASKRCKGSELSPTPAKCQRTKNKQSAGSSYVFSNEVTEVAEAGSTSHSDIMEADEIEEKHNRKIEGKYCSNNAGRTAVQIDNIKLMTPNYVIEDTECLKQLTTVATVNIEQQTNNVAATSDSGISEEEHHSNDEYCGANGCIKKYNINKVDGLENKLQIAKASRTKVLKNGEVKSCDVETVICVKEANINVHSKKIETYSSLEDKRSDLNNRGDNCEPSTVGNRKGIKNPYSFKENNLNIVDKEINGMLTKLQTRTKGTKTPVLITNNVINIVHESNKKQNTEKERSTIETQAKLLKTKDNNLFSYSSNDSKKKASEVRTQTKVSKTNCYSSDNLEKENSSVKTKTKVLKTKGIFPKASDDVLDDTETPKVRTKAKILKENYGVFTDKTVKRVAVCKAYELPQSELVKKRVEEFEKVLDQNIPVENGTGIMTRTKAKALKASVTTDNIETALNKPNCKPAVTGGDRGIIHNSSLKLEEKRNEEMSRKQKKADAAVKKKEKTLKATSEETRRRREEKLQKVNAARQVVEKEKAAVALKTEKEKEEREKQIQLDKKKEITRKKLITQQKVQEAEERRKKDEAARLAKIQEQEEEKKRILANRQKDQEAAEHLRQMEELRIKEAEKLKEDQKLHKLASANDKLHDKGEKSAERDTYDKTPHRNEKPIIMPKTENDYGLMDCHTDDSSEDEQRPKKKVPQWALEKHRNEDLNYQKYLTRSLSSFIICNPNPVLKELFPENGLPSKRFHRTSSAIWATPPVY